MYTKVAIDYNNGFSMIEENTVNGTVHGSLFNISFNIYELY